MWIFALPALVVVAFYALIAGYQAGGVEDRKILIDAKVSLYRTFVSTSSLYFAVYPPPSARTVYDWSELRKAAPRGVATAEMPASWKAVRGSEGTWAACTDLPEEAIPQVGALFPPVKAGDSSRVVDLGAGAVKAIGFGSDVEAMNAADLCKGA